MTIGIYALQFNDDLTYIGQSIDVESRIHRHIRELKSNIHYNYRMKDAYKLYGIPSWFMVEKCLESELNFKENQWIREFDSCINGLNIRNEEESVLRGPNANSAKYSKDQIINVMLLLCDPNNSSRVIEGITGVPSGNVNSIARGASHLWLKEVYPSEYSTMLSYKGKRNGKQNSTINRNGKMCPDLIDPTGNIHRNISNISEFCKLRNLNPEYFYMLTNGHCKSTCGGWKLYRPVKE